jgi:hypothetical protein
MHEGEGMHGGGLWLGGGGLRKRGSAGGCGGVHKHRNHRGKQLGRGGVCPKAGGGWEVHAWACMNGGASAKVDTVGGWEVGGMRWHPEWARAGSRLTQRLRASATLATTPGAIDRVSTLNPMRFPAASPHGIRLRTCPHLCRRPPSCIPRFPPPHPPVVSAFTHVPSFTRTPASQLPPTSGYECGNKASG